jgi:hypothetical protein
MFLILGHDNWSKRTWFYVRLKVTAPVEIHRHDQLKVDGNVDNLMNL